MHMAPVAGVCFRASSSLQIASAELLASCIMHVVFMRARSQVLGQTFT